MVFGSIAPQTPISKDTAAPPTSNDEVFNNPCITDAVEDTVYKFTMDSAGIHSTIHASSIMYLPIRLMPKPPIAIKNAIRGVIA